MDKNISSIKEDFRYQKVEWKVKRISWICMGLFLFYGLLGGFGDKNGWLNKTKVKIEGATIVYAKYLRVQNDFETEIYLDDTVRNFSIAFNRDYINKIQITEVVPEPFLVEILEEKIIYKFKTHKAGTIIFYNDPISAGEQRLDVMVNSRKLNLHHFIFF